MNDAIHKSQAMIEEYERVCRSDANLDEVITAANTAIDMIVKTSNMQSLYIDKLNKLNGMLSDKLLEYLERTDVC